MRQDRLILYACGSGLIVDYVDVCRRQSVAIKAIINNLSDGGTRAVPCVPESRYDFDKEKAPFLVPLFTPRNRYLAVRQAEGHGLRAYGMLSDPGSDLPEEFRHGAGCFINKGVVLGGGSHLGDFVLVNRGACLGHHQDLADFVSIGPGVVTGGDVTIGTGAMIATGAVILPDITIGEHAVVGGGAVVIRDVEPHTVVVGNPARVIRQNDNAYDRF